MAKFGLPHGEKETLQLRKRFNNYMIDMERQGKLGYLDKKDKGHLLKQNNFYEFNKPEYDRKKKAINKALGKMIEHPSGGKMREGSRKHEYWKDIDRRGSEQKKYKD